MDKYTIERAEVGKPTEKWKNGIAASLLRSYADSLKERQNGELIDSDILIRAAVLLEKYCPEVIEHEENRKKLLGSG